MPSFGVMSRQNLAECHPLLQSIFNKAIEIIDCTIIDGKRTYAEQVKNVQKGVSKTLDSMHLPRDPKTGIRTDGTKGVSFAVDAMPYPVDWNALQRGLDAIKKVDPSLQLLRAYYFQGIIKGIAHARGIDVRQGIDFNMNGQLGDQSFIDMDHTELHHL